MYIEENAASSSKVGRPKEVKGKRRGFNVSFYMDDIIMDALEEIHWRERKSISELVRVAVEEYAERHKEGNSSFKIDIWTENPDFQVVPMIYSNREKWQQYIKECNNEELTKLGVASHDIHNLVDMRRTKEFREREKQ